MTEVYAEPTLDRGGFIRIGLSHEKGRNGFEICVVIASAVVMYTGAHGTRTMLTEQV